MQDEQDGGEFTAAPQAEEQASTNHEERKYEEDLLRERARQVHEAEMFSSSESVLRMLFEEYPDAEAGKDLSRLERQVNKYTSSSLSYGELPYSSFHRIFTRLNRLGLSDDNRGKFVDIGSGVGKSVFAAALYHNFSKVVGIEILSGLHQASLGVFERWKTIKRQLSQFKSDMEISLLMGDALTIDWAQGTDVVFMYATCFSREMLVALGREACRLRSGSLVIITTYRLDSSIDPLFDKYLELVLTESADASFGGSVAVFFYRRTKLLALDAIADNDAYVSDLLSREV